MGGLISRFRKEKTSTKEILEKIEEEIESIQIYTHTTEEWQKRALRRIFLYSTIILLIAVAVFIFVPSTQRHSLYYLLGLVAFIILVWSWRKVLAYHCKKTLERKAKRLEELKKEKSTILDKVMDTETYKVAKEILDRFGPEKLKAMTPPRLPQPPVTSPRPPLAGHAPVRPQGPPARQENPTGQQSRLPVPNTPRPMAPVPPTPGRPGPPLLVRRGPLPRPILPPNRGVVDRLLDYLVGDGPSQRYALLCRHCAGHNGMALREEFEYIAFHCCYCFQFNPARKQRPHAPPLPVPVPSATVTPEPLSQPAIEPSSLGKSSSDESAESSEEECSTSIEQSMSEVIPDRELNSASEEGLRLRKGILIRGEKNEAESDSSAMEH